MKCFYIIQYILLTYIFSPLVAGFGREILHTCRINDWDIRLNLTSFSHTITNSTRHAVYLGNPSCGGSLIGDTVYFYYRYKDCSTTTEIRDGNIFFSNALFIHTSTSGGMSEIWRIDVMCFMTLHQVASVHFLPIIRSTTVSQLTSRMETSLPPTSETFVSTSDSAVSNSQRSQKTAEVSATTDGHGSTPIFSSIQVSTTADTGHSRTIHSQTSTNRHSSVSDTTALVPKTTIVSSFGMTDRAPTSRITTLYSSTIDSTNTIGKTTTPPLIVSFPTTEGGHTSRIQYQQSTSLSSSTIDSTNVIGKTTTPPLTSSFPTTDGGYTSRLNYQQSTTKYSSTTDFTATATSTSVQLSTTKNHHQTSTTPITSRTDSTSSSRISTTSPTYSTISTHNVSTMSTIKTTQCKVCSGSFCGAFPQMETNVLCSNQKPFCMNTISFSTTSQKKVEKRCASTNECETLWWKQTSDDFDLCVEMNKKRVPSSDMDCHFCCVQDGCNQPVVPVKGTFYQGSS